MKPNNSTISTIKKPDKKFNFDKFIYALAPMAGVTDFAFRKICSDFGADMVVTEMISLKALANKNFKTEKMLREESNAIRCCQLFYHEANLIKKAFENNLFDHFDIIDLNCGCPAPKIIKNKEGSAMMRDIENSRKVISTLVEYSNKPVSVKFRLGIDDNINYIEFAKMCEECGVSFLTLHARTREQGYSGEVDKSAYEKLISSVNVPIFWSGDIRTKEDCEYAKKIGCAGVMIGRSAMGNPEIFTKLKSTNILSQTNELKILCGENLAGSSAKQLSEILICKSSSTDLIKNPLPDSLSKNDSMLTETKNKNEILSNAPYSKKQAILNHLSLLKTYFKAEDKLVAYFKKHLMWYVKSTENATTQKLRILQFTTLKQIETAIEELF